MSNDLLFSVLPREGKVPVVSDDRVKRVSKESKSKQLSEDEKETHDEERLISEQQQYKVHKKAHKDASDPDAKDPGQQSSVPHEQSAHTNEDEDELTYNSHGETEEHRHDADTPHIDTYG